MGLAACALAVAIAGCNEEEQDASGAADEITRTVEDPVKEAAGEDAESEAPDSCEVLTEEIVRERFDIAADVEVKQSVFDVVHHTCTYRWDKPNAEEQRAKIEKQQQERVNKMMKDMRKGKKVQGIMDLATDMPRVENEVSLTLTNFDFDSASAAKKRFEQNVEMLGKGVKRKVKTKNIDEDVEIKAESEPVEGIGDGAAWNERLNELMLVQGTRLFNVVVNIHEDRDKNRELAKKLAERVIEEL
ncbi:MAG: hypothetical protein ACOCUS_00260 [Polyangiales bacterium]